MRPRAGEDSLWLYKVDMEDVTEGNGQRRQVGRGYSEQIEKFTLSYATVGRGGGRLSLAAQ